MRTPITYYGGKQSMLKEILPMIPEHRIYCEPYLGGGAVFFGKDPSYLEVINDTNNRLITFYEVMRDQFEDLYKMISDTLHSEKMHKKAKDIYHFRIATSDLEMAWAVWVVLNMSFAGSAYGGWKWSNGKAGSHEGRYIARRINDFESLKDRLRTVQICCRDAIEVIKKRDTENTFFYIDTPYPGSDQGHYKGYTFRQFADQLQQLSRLKGKFLLSTFWSQTLKFHIIKYGWQYKVIRKQMKVANFSSNRYKEEILVWNYDVNASEIQNQN